jgi:tellurite resistance protein
MRELRDSDGKGGPVATKADFTDNEWEAMQKGVTGAGMLVSVGDRDFTDSFGEASALAKALAAQREQSASELVRELANVRGTGFGLTASPQEVESGTLASLRLATETLAAKAPDEAETYRDLVLAVAETVAEAKGGVKPGETAALDKIREALGAV